MKCAEKPLETLPAQTQENNCLKSKIMELCNFVMLLVLGPYHLLKMFVMCNDKHEFAKNVFKPDFQDIWKTQGTSTVSKKRLRSVRDSYGVSMSALITTLFGQAVYKSIKKSQTEELANSIHGFLSYPLPGHKDMLTNHWTLIKISIKVNENDPVETLKFVEKEFRSLRTSVKPLVFYYVSKMLALAPLGLRKGSMKPPPITFVLTNFPGPSVPSDIFGCRWKQTNLAGKGAGGSGMNTEFQLSQYRKSVFK